MATVDQPSQTLSSEAWTTVARSSPGEDRRSENDQRQLLQRIEELENDLRSSVERHRLELKSLGQAITALRHDFAAEASPNGAIGLHGLGLERPLASIVEATRELFPGSPIELDVEYDPNDGGAPIVGLVVRWNGEPKESVDLRLKWHDRVCQIEGCSNSEIVLYIYPRT